MLDRLWRTSYYPYSVTGGAHMDVPSLLNLIAVWWFICVPKERRFKN